MSNILKITEELCNELVKTEQYVKYQTARDAYDANEEIQNGLKQYETLSMEMENARQSQDEAKFNELSAQIKDTVDNIMKIDAMKTFTNAKNELEGLLQQINKMIMATITGDEGCSPSQCESCSGCGH